MKIKQNTLK